MSNQGDLSQPADCNEKNKTNIPEVLSSFDVAVVRVMEFLLQPMREDILNLWHEVKQDIMECTKLHEENANLYQRVQCVEDKNKELSKRVSELENKWLEI